MFVVVVVVAVVVVAVVVAVVGVAVVVAVVGCVCVSDVYSLVPARYSWLRVCCMCLLWSVWVSSVSSLLFPSMLRQLLLQCVP